MGSDAAEGHLVEPSQRTSNLDFDFILPSEITIQSQRHTNKILKRHLLCSLKCVSQYQTMLPTVSFRPTQVYCNIFLGLPF